VRDTYRLTVSADNILRPKYLDHPARILGFRNAQDLLSAYHACTQRVSESVERMIADALD
jgi:hypothetical protein